MLILFRKSKVKCIENKSRTSIKKEIKTYAATAEGWAIYQAFATY